MSYSMFKIFKGFGVALIAIVITIVLFFSFVFIVNLREFKGGQWQTHSFPEYEFKDKQTRQEFENWIEHISPLIEIPMMGFDVCYLPWNDTIWDRTYRLVVDTFNLRLHTHRAITNYFRTEEYYSKIKGVCRLNMHWLYLYDDITINRYFISKGRNRTIYSIAKDTHSFLQWYDDEKVYIAQASEHIRPIETHNRFFYEGYAFFFETTDYSDYTLLHDVVERDSFRYRSCGPYLVLSEKDTLSIDETNKNFEHWVMNNISSTLLDSVSKESRVSVVCHVDTLGKIVSYVNYSSEDLKEEASKLLTLLPDLEPAMERGITVNSERGLRCIPYYCRKQ